MFELSPLSGGRGAPNGDQDEVRGGEPSGEPPLTSSRSPFGPPRPPDNGDNKIAFLFREKSVQC